MAREDLRKMLVDSEQFMWLMLGGDEALREQRLEKLRPIYLQYRNIGGGWGNKTSTPSVHETESSAS